MEIRSKDRTVVVVAYLSALVGLGIAVPVILLLVTSRNATSRRHVKLAIMLQLAGIALCLAGYAALVPPVNETIFEAVALLTIVVVTLWALKRSLQSMNSVVGAPIASGKT